MKKTLYSMVMVMDLYLRKLPCCFQLASNYIIYTLELLILLSSDASLYRDTFDMIH